MVITSLLHPSVLDSRRMQGAAYLLVIAAWLLTGVIKGIPLFAGVRDLPDALFGLLLELAGSAAVYILILAAGAKKPVISGVLLLFFTIIGFLAMPSYFMPGHSLDGNSIARVVFIGLLGIQATAAVLFFLSARRGSEPVEITAEI